jgi:hypothetical protein
MAPTPVLLAKPRFYQPGITRIYFVPTIANPSAPTRAELAAGTDVTKQVRAIDGWLVSADQLEAADMGSRFTGKVGGRTSADNSALTYYGAQDGIDIRGLHPRGALGFYVFLDGGDVEDYLMDVYPIEVISLGKNRGDSDPFNITIQFSITSEPFEDVDIPAAA